MATSATLPFDYALTPATNTTYFFITNYRNQFNLVTESLDAYEMFFDGSGTVSTSPPSAPVFTVTQTSGGAFVISAQYFYLNDFSWELVDGQEVSPAQAAINAQMTFHVYLSTAGTPLLSSPIDVALGGSLGSYFQATYTTGTYSIPTTLSVVVRMYRGEDTTESINSAIETAESLETVFEPPDLTLFYLGVAQQST